jgi:hypothetical protein
MEHFGDKERLFSYAVDNCREKLNSLFMRSDYCWDDAHDILIAAGLQLRQKVEGLAIYDVADDEQCSVKASDLHPELTLSCQQELIGAFTPASVIREVNRDGKDVLLSALDIESQYDNRLHRRDKGGEG